MTDQWETYADLVDSETSTTAQDLEVGAMIWWQGAEPVEVIEVRAGVPDPTGTYPEGVVGVKLSDGTELRLQPAQHITKYIPGQGGEGSGGEFSGGGESGDDGGDDN